MARVLLISMPWCAASRPNLSAGILKELATQAGSQCDVLDAGLLMSSRIGPAAYEVMAETPMLFGLCEHIFACDLFGKEALASDDFLDAHALGDGRETFVSFRDTIVPDFLADLQRTAVGGDHQIVGFTCTFNQVFPSLALARRIKSMRSDRVILLGGACVHGPMGEEYARAFADTVDHVFLGEADESFPAFLRAWDRKESLRLVRGITVGGKKSSEPVPTHLMSEVPAPNFDDYFALRGRLASQGHEVPEVTAIPYEGSRGCWWGEKHHCTFCGLNNQGMSYRSKPASQVANEVRALAARYSVLRFMAADNIITHRDFQVLVEELRELDGDFRFFYEVKANLKRDDVAALAAAGIRWIQPGIEAFSDRQLSRMKKGTTALQNVVLLRLCQEHGIATSYNILVGFPGETEDDYIDQIALMAKLHHLSPPSGDAGLAQVHRFSPFHSQREIFGFRALRPMSYYYHLVPQNFLDLDEIAYFFDRDLPKDSAYARMIGGLQTAIRSWRSARRHMSLRLGPGFGELQERIGGEAERSRSIALLDVVLLITADRPISTQALITSAVRSTQVRESEVGESLARLIASGLLVEHAGNVASSVPFEVPQSSASLSSWILRWAADRSTATPPGTLRFPEGAVAAAPGTH